MSLALIFALALQAEPAAAVPAPGSEPAAHAAAAEAPLADDYPKGAPRDDYELVAWCYGALRGYVDLHDKVMPEVTRIESSFRRPGSRLEDDLKVYADQQREARLDLKRFQTAMTAAEKASLRPLNAAGAQAVEKGHAVWSAAANVSKARLAQEWMSWTLPARCQTTAASLEQRARLMSPAFKANVPEAAPAPQ